jgi:DNA-binding NarL/FixJ family response regulator
MNLSTTEGILIEPGAGSRSALREVMWRAGVRRIVQFDDMPSAKSEEFASADVILIGLDGTTPEALSIVRQVRQRVSAANPFAFVFATHFGPTRESIIGALEAGVDTVLGKPLSAATLSQHVAAQIASPRKWLVSSNYVGPERAAGPGSGQGTRLTAPHVLQLKTSGASSKEIQDAVRKTWTEVAQHRALHTAYQVGVWVARAEAAPTDPAAIADLKLLGPMLTDLMPQIEDPDRRFEAQIAADELLARVSNLPVAAAARVASLSPALVLAAQILCLTVGRGQVDRAVGEIRAVARSGLFG